MTKISILKNSDRIFMEKLFRDDYNNQMPKTGEVIIRIGDYGVDNDVDHSILMSFLEQVFAFEIEQENVSIFIIPEDYGAIINLVKDFNPYD